MGPHWKTGALMNILQENFQENNTGSNLLVKGYLCASGWVKQKLEN